MSDSRYVEATKSAEQRLGHFIEECGEALAAAGKSVRWGLNSFNPELDEDDRETNRDWLLREMDDLELSMKRLREVIMEQPSFFDDPNQDRR